MKFIADIHVHSKYSRATAKNLDLENLYVAAKQKGITLVGTGDFTHPAWFSEIQEKLVPAEQGLFRLKPDIAKNCDLKVPESCKGDIRFILQCELSNIYKKNGKTRKNHHIILMPDMDTARRFSLRMENIGNIKSDGRPILGLDAKHLLEILLETSSEAMFIPAHIWTPWFSVFGSKSGFDSLTECFEDMTPEIFAAETGLSSDPPMNWRISELDRLTLVSNSDAHSPSNLGRNANVFDIELSYEALRSALKSKDPCRCLGTLDMYPEEGKYHYDGHRKCNICLHPSETISKKGICPVCGKPLTIGVLYRVYELSDRSEGFLPENRLPYYSIIPLPEIISELLQVGAKSKKVGEYYHTAIETLGSELEILLNCPIEALDNVGIPLLGEAIRRMREKKVHIEPGYDGEYGKITLFTPDERERLMGQKALFAGGSDRKRADKKLLSDKKLHPKKLKSEDAITPTSKNKEKFNLNSEQRQAVEHSGGPLLIIAGPGAGKTQTLTLRIAYIINEKNVLPENILAVTFTNKAANEMKERLKSLIKVNDIPLTATFHSLCFHILKAEYSENITIIDEDDRKAMIAEAARSAANSGNILGTDKLLDQIIWAKQHVLTPEDDLSSVLDKADAPIISEVYRTYQAMLSQEQLYDYEDLIISVVKRFESDSAFIEKYRHRFQYIFVDEYQDINPAQYRIIKALCPQNANLCVIGDPDQSIYGFRGADVRFFQQFEQDYPSCSVIRLTQNYRSAKTILEASHQVIKNYSLNVSEMRVYSEIEGIKTLTIFEAPSEKAEAVAIGKAIEKMVGGTGFYSVDFGKTDETSTKPDLSFSDFAVLCRTHAQLAIIASILEDAGIPCQVIQKKNRYGRKGIAELISFLKLSENIGIFNDFERIAMMAGSGISKKAFHGFKSWFYKSGFSLSEALSKLSQSCLTEMEQSDWQRFCLFLNRLSEIQEQMPKRNVHEKLIFILENTQLSEIIRKKTDNEEILKSLLHMAEAFDNKTNAFLEMIALQTDPDTHDPEAEKIALMTIHAAKGLEFPVVFIAGCEKDYIPFKRSAYDTEDIDEERRLFYVAMTRAKDQLFLSYAKKRTVYGKIIQREISPFVEDIEKHLLKIEKSHSRPAKAKPLEQMDIFIEV